MPQRRWLPFELHAAAPVELARRVGVRAIQAAWLGYFLGALDGVMIAGEFGAARRLQLVFGCAAAVAIVAGLLGAGWCLLGGLTQKVMPRGSLVRVHVDGHADVRLASGTAGTIFGLIPFIGALLASERIMVSSMRLSLLMLAATASMALAVVMSQRLEGVFSRLEARRQVSDPSALSRVDRRFLVVLVPVLTTVVTLIATGRWGMPMRGNRRAVGHCRASIAADAGGRRSRTQRAAKTRAEPSSRARNPIGRVDAHGDESPVERVAAEWASGMGFGRGR